MPLRRTLKNVVKNYSDAQVKVREATSNDPWGPSSTLMMEIADLTYNVLAFTEIMQMIWKRLNDHGRNWRHVYKALVLLEYIVKTGSEKVAHQCRENIFTIQTLKDFQYIEDAKDHGLNIREKAKALVLLLKDNDRLKNERAKALKAKERFAQTSAGVGSGPTYPSGSPVLPSVMAFTENVVGRYSEFGSPSSWSLEGEAPSLDAELEAVRPTSTGEEELQLQLALAMSKEEHEQQLNRLKGDEVKLQIALEQSRLDLESNNKTVDFQKNGLTFSDLDKCLGAEACASTRNPWNDSSIRDNSSIGAQLSEGAWGTEIKPVTHMDPWSAVPMQNNSDHAWSGAVNVFPVNSKSLPPKKLKQYTSSSIDHSMIGGGASSLSHSSTPWDSPEHQPLPKFYSSPSSNNINDEFDKLSTRLRIDNNFSHIYNMNLKDFDDKISKTDVENALDKVTRDPWNMDTISQTIFNTSTSVSQPSRGKSPKDFLGKNANLVNLDNLLSQPKISTTSNPFGVFSPASMSCQHNLIASRGQSPANNPFALQITSDIVSFNQPLFSNQSLFVDSRLSTEPKTTSLNFIGSNSSSDNQKVGMLQLDFQLD